MFKHGLIVPSTILRYDDWPEDMVAHGGMYGEARAHHEISAMWGVEWQSLNRNPVNLGRTCRHTYQVMAIGRNRSR